MNFSNGPHTSTYLGNTFWIRTEIVNTAKRLKSPYSFHPYIHIPASSCRYSFFKR